MSTRACGLIWPDDRAYDPGRWPNLRGVSVSVRRTFAVVVLLGSLCTVLACADDAASVILAPDAGEVADALGVDAADGREKDASRPPESSDEGPEVAVEPGQDGVSDEAADDATAPDAEPIGEPGPDVAADLVTPDLSSVEQAEIVDCPAPPDLSYTCHVEEPASCPGGLCLGGLCLGPVRDPERWASCGDGACHACESSAHCPADCGAPPVFTGEKVYANDTTLSVWLHGWSNKGDDDLTTQVYGQASGCGGTLEEVRAFGVVRPCYDDPGGAAAPNQLVKIEYWGALAPDWMPAAHVAEIEALPYDEGTTALLRYALVAARAIRHRLDVTGATHVNLACHSFGCLVARTMLERDLAGLASEQRVVRWVTSAGVLAGARLSRLYDNPDVQNVGALIGLNLQDWVVMNPDFVTDNVAIWDHASHQGNNPLYRDMLIHHVAGTDPRVKAALNIQLLDLNNPGDEPNDGIMYSFDTFFHQQAPGAALHLPNGQVLPSTHSFVHEYHEYVPEHPAFAVLAAAGLFHSRKVLITLRSLELKDDREQDGPFDFSENGSAPAEIAFEVDVRYDPYVSSAFGRPSLVAEQRLADRSPDLFQQAEGTSSQPQRRVFEGPIFDEMTELWLDLWLLEVDWYPRFGVLEWAADTHEALAAIHQSIPLVDGVVPFETEYAKGELKIEIKTLY